MKKIIITAVSILTANFAMAYLVTGLLQRSPAFVPVKAATFYMGSPSFEENRSNDETIHEVTLTKDFEIGATEVTQLQWVVVMGSNPSEFQKESHCPDSYMEIDGVSLCSDFPVERVSWIDIVGDKERGIKGFLEEYNERAKDNFTYRLPTSAEWELAARAGTTTAYSFGDNSSVLTDYAWFGVNSGRQTRQTRQARAVATKKPNLLEIYDVHGNVWEFVQDWYGDYPNSSVTNPTGPRSGSYRVIRGGGWGSVAGSLRSASRGGVVPEAAYTFLGFRLARTPK